MDRGGSRGCKKGLVVLEPPNIAVKKFRWLDWDLAMCIFSSGKDLKRVEPALDKHTFGKPLKGILIQTDDLALRILRLLER